MKRPMPPLALCVALVAGQALAADQVRVGSGLAEAPTPPSDGVRDPNGPGLPRYAALEAVPARP